MVEKYAYRQEFDWEGKKMKGKRWIAALLALLLVLPAGLAMAEAAADVVPFGQTTAPDALRGKLLSKGVVRDHITPNAGYQQCFQYDHDIRYEFDVNQPSVVTIEMRVKKSQRGPILFYGLFGRSPFFLLGARIQREKMAPCLQAQRICEAGQVLCGGGIGKPWSHL